MKQARFLLIAALAATALPLAAAQPDPEPEPEVEIVERRGDMISIFSGDVLVPAGTRQHGSVICVGSEARIDGEVLGDVVVVMGRLDNRGRVGGAVTGVMTDQVHTDARVAGEVVNVLGTVKLERTRVSRELINVLGGFTRDAGSSGPSMNIGFGSWFPSFAALLLWLRLARLFGVFVLLLLLVALVPERVSLIAEEAPVRYAMAFFVGLLGYLGLLVLLTLLSVTVIGLPLAYLGWVVLKWLAIAGIFLAVGRRLGRAFGRELSLMGAVLLVFGVYALITLAPTPLGLFGLPVSILIAAMFLVLVEVPAVGLMLLTYGGGRSGRVGLTPPPAPAAPAPVPPPPVV